MILIAALAALAAPVSAGAADWNFKTPGEAAYCRMEFSRHSFDAFLCITPNDGFWIRFTGINAGAGRDVRIVKGYASRYRGYRNRTVHLLGFGRRFFSSDAAVITCWSRPGGLTCKHYSTGLSFWLGRYRGYRIYRDIPGLRPSLRPLFRTGHGIYCGIPETHEPQVINLFCWNPRNALGLSLLHDRRFGTRNRASYARRDPQLKGWRPRRFPLLGYGRSLSWRCQTVEETEIGSFAQGCSRSRGIAVITCTSSRARLTCQNTGDGGGFWVNARRFSLF